MNGEPRALKSRTMRIWPGYVAQFDLVMGCGAPFSKNKDNAVYFQYSTDHGTSWHHVSLIRLCMLFKHKDILFQVIFDKMTLNR